MNKIKKILKSFLAVNLFVVGLVCNPLSIKAEEAGTYAAPSYTRTNTYTVYHSSSGLISLDVTWLYLADGGITGMHYQSASCENDSGGTCRVYGHSVQGSSTDQTNDQMTVTVTLTGKYNNKNYIVYHKFYIQRNSITNRVTYI